MTPKTFDPSMFDLMKITCMQPKLIPLYSSLLQIPKEHPVRFGMLYGTDKIDVPVRLKRSVRSIEEAINIGVYEHLTTGIIDYAALASRLITRTLERELRLIYGEVHVPKPCAPISLTLNFGA